jgi:hypothetical protein
VLRFDPVILDEAMQIRYLPAASRRGRTGEHFSPITGAESDYQGASRGREPGVDSSVSNVLVADTIIVILTIKVNGS